MTYCHFATIQNCCSTCVGSLVQRVSRCLCMITQVWSFTYSSSSVLTDIKSVRSQSVQSFVLRFSIASWCSSTPGFGIQFHSLSSLNWYQCGCSQGVNRSVKSISSCYLLSSLPHASWCLSAPREQFNFNFVLAIKLASSHFSRLLPSCIRQIQSHIRCQADEWRRKWDNWDKITKHTINWLQWIAQ